MHNTLLSWFSGIYMIYPQSSTMGGCRYHSHTHSKTFILVRNSFHIQVQSQTTATSPADVRPGIAGTKTASFCSKSIWKIALHNICCQSYAQRFLIVCFKACLPESLAKPASCLQSQRSCQHPVVLLRCQHPPLLSSDCTMLR